MSRTTAVLGSICGVAFAVVQMALAFAVPAPPTSADRPVTVAAYLVDNRATLRVTFLVGTLAGLLVLVFLAALWAAFRDLARGTTPALIAAAMGGAAALAVSTTASVAGLAAVGAATEPGADHGASAVYGLQVIGFVMIALPAAAFLVAFAVQNRATPFMARWVSALGYIAAGLLLVTMTSVLSDDPTWAPGAALLSIRELPFAVWVIAASLALWRASRRSNGA